MIRTILVAMVLAGSLPSGPQVGDAIGNAKNKEVLGPDAGKESSILDRAKKEPSLLVFVHKLTRPAFRLLKAVDAAAAKHEELNRQFIFLTGDLEETEAYLKRAKDSLNFQTPVSVNLDGKNGPDTYGLNDQVTLTILAVKEGKVVANFALVDPNERDAPKIIESIKKITTK